MLLGDPQVLVLDAANGLDPAGIRWMRGLLRGFADRGGTVLLSSHLLHEIEVVADQLVVIGRGRIVAEGSKADMLAPAGTLVRGSGYLEPLRAARVAAAVAFRQRPDGVFIVDAEPVAVGRAAAARGVVLVELRPTETEGLEEVFMQLTAGDARDAFPPPPRPLSPLPPPPPPPPGARR